MRKTASKLWLHQTLILAIGVGLVAGCKASPLGVLNTAAAGGASAAAFQGEGSANITVNLAEDKASAALTGKRKVQSVNLARAYSAALYYTGAGIDSWAGGWSKNFPAPVGGTRTMTINATSIPAGPRRVFKLQLFDNAGALLEEYWGVADIVAGATPVNVTLSRGTTPTGKIFRKLLTTKDVEKVLQIPVADVQGFVDKLLNTDATTGAALDGTKPQLNYSLLNVDMAASAIAVGNGAPPVPYTVPTSVPASMTPTPLRKGALTIKAVDVKGQAITTECVVFLNDQASLVQRSTPGQAVNMSFPDVTPGTWTATVVDINSGRTGTGSVTIGEGQSRTYSVMLPIQKLDLAVGAPNLEASYSGVNYGYNGDNLHPLLTYLNNPRAMAINNGVLYWAEYGNKRIRSVDLNSNNPVVKTVAGNGTDPISVAPESSQATNVPVQVDYYTTLTFDGAGNLYFTEPSYRRVAKVNLTTGELTTAIAATAISSVLPSYANIATISYDKATDTMYFVDNYNQYTYSVTMTGATAYPAAGCCAKVDTKSSGSGVLRSGNFVFYTSGNQLYRKNLTTNLIETMCGKTTTYNAGNGVPAQDFYVYGYNNMQIDAIGNLYFTSGSVYRITNALVGTEATNDWLVNNLGFSANGFVVDGTSGNFYASGTFNMPDPTGYYWQGANINSINVVRP